MPRKIKAPFNFVPLQDRVYFPQWADQVSQDIPFSDGVSGTIRLTITAETPIMVGAGKQDESNRIEFCKSPDGRYYIPGSTIKGTLRSVLEILSFGKMTQVSNRNFYIREFKGGDGTFYRAVFKPANVHCGWLKVENNAYFVEDCGTPLRVSASELDRQFPNFHLTEFIQNSDFSVDSNKLPKAKYGLFERNYTGQDLVIGYRLQGENYGRKVVSLTNDVQAPRGTLVFTGQSGRREGTKGKFYEFVFPHVINSEGILVTEDVMEAFFSIYKETDNFKNFWRKKLLDGERIPVFFVMKDGFVDCLGLSYMMKYPSQHDIYDGIKQVSRDLMKGANKKDGNQSGRDLCECIFGCTAINPKEDSLKGRVHVSHAFMTQGHTDVERTIVLSTPQPSFYPIYLGSGLSWNSGEIKIAGRKRYPVRNNVWSWEEGSQDMKRRIVPMARGAIFEGVIRFHNLRPVELGGVIAALTFNGDRTCFHNMGMAKPLGYGKVSIDVDFQEQEKFLNAFREAMRSECSGWDTCEQLRELKAMAQGIPAERDTDFRYMDMSAGDFVEVKNNYAEEQLGLFTEIIDNTFVPSVLASNEINRTRHDSEKMTARAKELKGYYAGLLKQLFSRGKYREAIEISKKCDSSSDSIQEELKKLKEMLATTEQKVAQARDLRNEGKFDEAILLLIEANEIGCNDLSREIEYTKQSKLEAGKLQEQRKIDKLKERAFKLKNERKFSESSVVFKQLELLTGEDFSALIEDCKKQIQKAEAAQAASIQDVIRDAPTGSPAAFINRFKGRKLTDDDLKEMAQAVKAAVKPRDLQKKWLNPREYQKVLGDRAELFVGLLKQ